MNLYAVMENGHIARTITTNTCLTHLKEQNPGKEIVSYYSLPDHIRAAYRYDSERP